MIPQYESSFEQQYTAFGRHSVEHEKTVDVLTSLMMTNVDCSYKKHINILSIGSGNGQFDILLAKALVLKYGSAIQFSYSCIEPNTTFNVMFRKSLEYEKQCRHDGFVNIEFYIKDQTYEEFLTSQKKNAQLYDLIIFSNSLGAVEDKCKTLMQVKYELLSSKGICVLIEATENEGCQKFINAMKKTELCSHVGLGEQQENTLEDVLGESIGQLIVRLDFEHEKQKFESHTDMTVCFDEGSIDGNLILDFMLMKEYCRKNIPQEIMQNILTVLSTVCEEENLNKNLLKSEIMVIKFAK